MSKGQEDTAPLIPKSWEELERCVIAGGWGGGGEMPERGRARDSGAEEEGVWRPGGAGSFRASGHPPLLH